MILSVAPDLDRTAIELPDLAQRFLRPETYARVKGRSDKRPPMAVIIGIDNRPQPLLEEFDITDSERTAVNDVVERITAALTAPDIHHRNIIHYMERPHPPKMEGNEMAVR